MTYEEKRKPIREHPEAHRLAKCVCTLVWEMDAPEGLDSEAIEEEIGINLIGDDDKLLGVYVVMGEYAGDVK